MSLVPTSFSQLATQQMLANSTDASDPRTPGTNNLQGGRPLHPGFVSGPPMQSQPPHSGQPLRLSGMTFQEAQAAVAARSGMAGGLAGLSGDQKKHLQQLYQQHQSLKQQQQSAGATQGTPLLSNHSALNAAAIYRQSLQHPQKGDGQIQGGSNALGGPLAPGPGGPNHMMANPLMTGSPQRHPEYPSVGPSVLPGTNLNAKYQASVGSVSSEPSASFQFRQQAQEQQLRQQHQQHQQQQQQALLQQQQKNFQHFIKSSAPQAPPLSIQYAPSIYLPPDETLFKVPLNKMYTRTTPLISSANNGHGDLEVSDLPPKISRLDQGKILKWMERDKEYAEELSRIAGPERKKLISDWIEDITGGAAMAGGLIHGRIQDWLGHVKVINGLHPTEAENGDESGGPHNSLTSSRPGTSSGGLEKEKDKTKDKEMETDSERESKEREKDRLMLANGKVNSGIGTTDSKAVAAKMRIRFEGDRCKERERGSRGAIRKEVKLSKRGLRAIAKTPEVLIPMRLEFEHEAYKLRDTFTWNLRETMVTPEIFASHLIEDLRLPFIPFYREIVSQINRHIEDAALAEDYDAFLGDDSKTLKEENRIWFMDRMKGLKRRKLLDSGPLKTKERENNEVRMKNRTDRSSSSKEMAQGDKEKFEISDNMQVDGKEDESKVALASETEAHASPSDGRQNEELEETPLTLKELPRQECANEELRVIIKLDITLDAIQLIDRFEWELSDSRNSPEEFAESFAAELGLSGEFRTAIAHSIREQIEVYTKSLCLLGHVNGLPIHDEELRREFLPALFGPFRADAADYTPILNQLTPDEVERNDKEREREVRRKRRQTKGRGVTLPDRDHVRTHRTLVPKPSNEPLVPFPDARGETIYPLPELSMPFPIGIPDYSDKADDNDAASPSAKEYRSLLAQDGVVVEHAPEIDSAGGAIRLKRLRQNDMSNFAGIEATATKLPGLDHPEQNTVPTISAKPKKPAPKGPTLEEMGLHEHIIDGVWHCANCGVPEACAVGRRKGLSGNNSLCGACGKFFHRYRRNRPCEYTTDLEVHLKAKFANDFVGKTGKALPKVIRIVSSADPSSSLPSALSIEVTQDVKPSTSTGADDLVEIDTTSQTPLVEILEESEHMVAPVDLQKDLTVAKAAEGPELDEDEPARETSDDEEEESSEHGGPESDNSSVASPPPTRARRFDRGGSPDLPFVQIGSPDSDMSSSTSGHIPPTMAHLSRSFANNSRRQASPTLQSPRQTRTPSPVNPPPPIVPLSWMLAAAADLRGKQTDDRFELIPRPRPLDPSLQEWRIRCLDCPGKLYNLGPGETLDNFSVHFKNRQHRSNVEARIKASI